MHGRTHTHTHAHTHGQTVNTIGRIAFWIEHKLSMPLRTMIPCTDIHVPFWCITVCRWQHLSCFTRARRTRRQPKRFCARRSNGTESTRSVKVIRKRVHQLYSSFYFEIISFVSRLFNLYLFTCMYIVLFLT